METKTGEWVVLNCFVTQVLGRYDTEQAAADWRVFLEANALPAGSAFRRQDALDNDSPSYVGDVGIGINPALAARVAQADVLLVASRKVRADRHPQGSSLHRATSPGSPATRRLPFKQTADVHCHRKDQRT